jgi:hypothetical protein
VSERVVPCLVLPRVVVTWFVTDFPDHAKVDGFTCGCRIEKLVADWTSLVQQRVVGLLCGKATFKRSA